MKQKINLIILLLILFISCETKDSDLRNKIVSKQKKEITKIPNNGLTKCTINGSKRACANNILTYTYTSKNSKSNLIWLFSNGISIISGQGTNTATFHFDSEFRKGYIEVINKTSKNCSDKIIISCN